MSKPQPWYATLKQPPRSAKDGRNRKPNPSSHGSPTVGTDQGTDNRTVFQTYTSTFYYSASTFNKPKPPTIPYAGIRAGELIGYRGWLVLHGNQLCSLAHKFIWEPGATIDSNIDECVDSGGIFLLPIIFGGVYSYADAKNVDSIIAELEVSEKHFPCSNPFIAYSTDIVMGFVSGTIKCWGEVIEHEKGYRAQYAKLTSLDAVVGQVDLPALRAKYGV